MHVTVLPDAIAVGRGRSAVIAVLVTNLSEVIDAYSIEVLGVDPAWVSSATPRVSLFPGESTQLDLVISPPPDTPAAQRPITISVRSENDTDTFSLTDVALTIEAVAVSQITVDPPMINAGKSAEFGLIVTNTGNAPAAVRAFGVDPEDLADFRIEPSQLVVPSGSSAVVRVEATGGRAWFGSPRPRTFTLGVDAETRLEAPATFIQRPRIPRWLISMAGLLAAATVFAFVLSHAFDRVVQEASVGDDVLDEALRSGEAGGAVVPANPGTVSGRLTTNTNAALATAAGFRSPGQAPGQAVPTSSDCAAAGSNSLGVAAVQIELFVDGEPDDPVATAATDDNGCFTLANLGEGSYKMLMSGAGYPDVWFVDDGPGTSSPADASPIEVELGKERDLGEVQVGGIPVTVQGQVAGDAAGATIKLVRPGVVDPDVPAVVAEVTVGADGSFVLPDIPSPADLEMIVEKPGFATTTRKVTLQPGGELGDISIQLTPADGQVTGSVFGPDGPLGGVEISATDGQYTIDTVTYTDGAVGTFTLRNLSAPGRYTVTAVADGFVPETQTVVLEANQTLVTMPALVLTPATGVIEGSVFLESAATGEIRPSGDVTITLTGGPDLEQTVRSFSGAGGLAGTYRFDGLPSPGTYTLTFAGGGAIPQVRVVDLDPFAGGSTATVGSVELRLEERRVEGVVSEDGGGGRVAGATVTLSDGAETRTLISADDPLGAFAFDDVPPGAYTLRAERAGAFATIVPIAVEPGVPISSIELRLAKQASLSGTIVTGGPCDVVVRLFPFGQFDSEPVDSVVPSNGQYEFLAVDAPAGYLVAVYTPSATEPLATTSVTSTPSTDETIPTIDVSAACASLGSR